MEIIKVQCLSKVIKGKKIIKDLSFSIKKGEVFGFIGQNGSGKTTTIRMMVGMIKPTLGTIYINGFDVQKKFSDAMKNIGGIVENPSLYQYMSGLENMQQRARNLGIHVTQEDLLEIVELVGLGSRIHEKTLDYSLGMKQRLSIGLSLIGNPEIIILDEPINGLDPQGIIEIRKLINHLSKKMGITIFISSHILSELEYVLDRGIIIHNGQKILDINKSDFQSTEENHEFQLSYKSDSGLEAIQSFFKNTKTKIIRITENHVLFSSENKVAQEILANFINKEIEITHFEKHRKSLEDMYLEAIGKMEEVK